MHKQMLLKYCEALDIKDFNNLTKEEKIKWEKLISLSPTSRGYVCIAKDQGVDILECFSRKDLYERYHSHLNLKAIAKYLNIFPKGILLKGNIALYFTKKDVEILDNFIFNTSKKDLIKIVSEQTCIEKYGAKSYRDLNSYKENLSKKIKNNWKQKGYRENISIKVKKNYKNKTLKEKEIKRDNIKKSMSLLPKEKRNHWISFSKEKKDLICQRISEGRKKYYQKAIKENTINFIVDGHCCSHKEKEVEYFIKSLGFEIKSNVRNLIKTKDEKIKELDIYVPEKKVAIEFDGVYWHSSRFSSVNYHSEKTELCEDLGIRLVHILDYYWNTKKDICKDIIKAALGELEIKIPARECQIKEIDSETYKDFLTKYHIQGAVNSSIRYGLLYKGELVQCIGLGKSRFKKDEIELYRMCSKNNIQVLGGFSKLLKHCGQKHIISYIDRYIYNGNGYKKSGWEFIKYTKPSYVYYKNNKIYNRLQFQKHKLSKVLDIYDPNKSEFENMEANKYLRIYDCGTIKVEWNAKN